MSECRGSALRRPSANETKVGTKTRGLSDDLAAAGNCSAELQKGSHG